MAEEGDDSSTQIPVVDDEEIPVARYAIATPSTVDPLLELARAEAELADSDGPDEASSAADVRRLLGYARPWRRPKPGDPRRPDRSEVWGMLAFSLAVGCWGLLLLAAFIASLGKVAVINAVFSSAAAIVLGTIGRRSRKGGKWAVIGRLMAWMTPAAVAVSGSLINLYRAFSSPFFGTFAQNLLVVVAVSVVYAAAGLFFFVFIDAVLD